jgi:hypothetical protein
VPRLPANAPARRISGADSTTGCDEPRKRDGVVNIEPDLIGRVLGLIGAALLLLLFVLYLRRRRSPSEPQERTDRVLLGIVMLLFTISRWTEPKARPETEAGWVVLLSSFVLISILMILSAFYPRLRGWR